VTPAERAKIRAIVERSCAEQNIPLTVAASVCREIAKALRQARKRTTPERAA
jgi:hypothetical protein